MKKLILGWLFGAVVAAQLLAANDAAVQEVLKLKQAGMSDDLIIAFIKSGNINYTLTADDLIKLRDQGLSNTILTAMIDSSSDSAPTPAPAAPQQAPQNVPLNLGNGVLSPDGETPAIQNAPLAPMAPVVGETPSQPVVEPQTVVVSQPAPTPQPVYFYQELSPYGSWILVDNEWYWQPTMVIVNRGWRPYWDGGNWVYTDAGWCWTSDYSWGGIAFHYGRWHQHPSRGWMWYPGREWAPAWVTWRHGGEYCGWAPLPPHSHFDFATGHYSYRGRRVEESFSFGLSFNHFSFSYTRELGVRNRHAFHDDREVRNIYSHTTVINNYTIVKGSGGHERRIVNRGIEPRQVVEHGGKPVETMRLQERTTDARAATRIDTKEKTVSIYRPPVTETRMSASGKPVPTTPGAIARPANSESAPQKRQEQRGFPAPTASQPASRINERQPMSPSQNMAPISRAKPPVSTSAPVSSQRPPATMAPSLSTSQRPPASTAPLPSTSQRPSTVAPAPMTPQRPASTAAPVQRAPGAYTPAQAPSRTAPSVAPARTFRPPAPAPAQSAPNRTTVAPPKQMEQRSAPLSPRMQSASPSNPGAGQRDSKRDR